MHHDTTAAAPRAPRPGDTPRRATGSRYKTGTRIRSCYQNTRERCACASVRVFFVWPSPQNHDPIPVISMARGRPSPSNGFNLSSEGLAVGWTRRVDGLACCSRTCSISKKNLKICVCLNGDMCVFLPSCRDKWRRAQAEVVLIPNDHSKAAWEARRQTLPLSLVSPPLPPLHAHVEWHVTGPKKEKEKEKKDFFKNTQKCHLASNLNRARFWLYVLCRTPGRNKKLCMFPRSRL